MILLQRGKEPDSLLRYRKSSSKACYEEITKEATEDIRRQLWQEQVGLCAYCMRQIRDYRDVRIEHYDARHPKNGSYTAADTLDYHTMLGVCYGNSIIPGGREEDKTCDAHRKNTPLTVDPFEVHSIRKIQYTSDGYITSGDSEIEKDLQETLNLNCAAVSLPQNRKEVLDRTKKEIYKMCGKKGHEAYLRVLRQLYDRYTKQRQLVPYCGIVIQWLEKELGII